METDFLGFVKQKIGRLENFTHDVSQILLGLKNKLKIHYTISKKMYPSSLSLNYCIRKCAANKPTPVCQRVHLLKNNFFPINLSLFNSTWR